MTVSNIKDEAQRCGTDLSGDSFTVCVVSPDTDLQEGEDPGTYDYFRTLVKRSMKRFAGAVTFPFENDKTLLVSIIGGKMQEKGYTGLSASAAGYCGKSPA